MADGPIGDDDAEAGGAGLGHWGRRLWTGRSGGVFRRGSREGAKTARALALVNAALITPRGVEHRDLFLEHGRFSESPSPHARRVDLTGLCVCPGFVNAHEHLLLNGFGRFAHTRTYPNSYEWIEASQQFLADPAIAAVRNAPEAARAWQGGLKNVLSGATTVAHHDPWSAVFEDPAFPVRVFREANWCHSLGLGGESPEITTRRYGPSVRASYEATRAGGLWFIHAAEGTDDIAAAELSRLGDLGCLSARTVVVHAVGCSARDIDRVIASGASVVWCPGSNVATLGRTLDPRRLFDAGRLAIGADSRISGSRDLLEEMKVARAHSDLSPREIIQLATGRAAAVLGAPDIGGLNVGQRADVIVFDARGLDPCEALLAAQRRDLLAVVRDGSPVVLDRRLADWFDDANVEASAISLDGAPKLCARALLKYDAATSLEPGVLVESIVRSPDVHARLHASAGAASVDRREIEP